MKFNALLRVAVTGVVCSLLSAQNTYSELDAEVIQEFLAELDERVEDEVVEEVVVEDQAQDLESLLQEEQNEIALESALEEFDDVVNSDTASRLYVREEPVAKKQGTMIPEPSEELQVQLPEDNKELAQIDESLSALKKELAELSQQNDQKKLEVSEAASNMNDLQWVQESDDITYTMSQPEEVEEIHIAHVSSDSIEQMEAEMNAEIERLEREALSDREESRCSFTF